MNKKTVVRLDKFDEDKIAWFAQKSFVVESAFDSSKIVFDLISSLGSNINPNMIRFEDRYIYFSTKVADYRLVFVVVVV